MDKPNRFINAARVLLDEGYTHIRYDSGKRVSIEQACIALMTERYSSRSRRAALARMQTRLEEDR